MNQPNSLKLYTDEVKHYEHLRIPIKTWVAEAKARALGTSQRRDHKGYLVQGAEKDSKEKGMIWNLTYPTSS
jgi:hypothetical protein